MKNYKFFYFFQSMVDGIAGEAIQFAPRPAKQEFKQGHERVLIPLLRMVETTALDHRLIQEAATETHVPVRMMQISFSIKER